MTDCLNTPIEYSFMIIFMVYLYRNLIWNTLMVNSEPRNCILRVVCSS